MPITVPRDSCHAPTQMSRQVPCPEGTPLTTESELLRSAGHRTSPNSFLFQLEQIFLKRPVVENPPHPWVICSNDLIISSLNVSSFSYQALEHVKHLSAKLKSLHASFSVSPAAGTMDRGLLFVKTIHGAPAVFR